jgi:hypothetical protein
MVVLHRGLFVRPAERKDLLTMPRKDDANMTAHGEQDMNGPAKGLEVRAPSDGHPSVSVLGKTTSEEVLKHSETEPEFLAASAVAEINKLMTDLTSARDYLSAEAVRIRIETDRLNNLSKAALTSVHLISDNLGKWNVKSKMAE